MSRPEQSEPHIVPASKRIPELDGLRGLAILLVILCHYVGAADHSALPHLLHRFLQSFGLGWSGVDLFFVLSGFLIGGILLESRDSDRFFQTFYLRRVHRIVPIYYLWIILFLVFRAASRWLSPGWQLLNFGDYSHVPLYLVFLQNYIFSRTVLDRIWFGVTWSLAVEEQFYLVAPPLIRFLTRRSLISVLLTVLVAAPIVRLLIFILFPNYRYLVTFAMPCRADALGIGILAAIGWHDAGIRSYFQLRSQLLRNLLIGSSAGVVLLAWWLEHPVSAITATVGYSWLAWFYCALILYVLQSPRSFISKASRLTALRQLGTISYCVYIIHNMINDLVHYFVHRSPAELNDVSGVLATLLALGLTLAVATISWRYFEKSLIRRGHRYSY